jgi:hypothetical protein
LISTPCRFRRRRWCMPTTSHCLGSRHGGALPAGWRWWKRAARVRPRSSPRLSGFRTTGCVAGAVAQTTSPGSRTFSILRCFDRLHLLACVRCGAFSVFEGEHECRAIAAVAPEA